MRARAKKSTIAISCVIVIIAVALTVMVLLGDILLIIGKNDSTSIIETKESIEHSKNLPALTSDAPKDTLEISMREKKLSFICAGDNLIHTDVYGSAARFAKGTGEQYDFKPMFSDIKELISSYDVAFLNQEVPIAGAERGFSGYPCFNSPDELGDAVVDTGFDVINIATNHMLDKRNAGLKRSIEYWRGKDVFVIGDYLSQEEYEEIEILEKDGIRIAFLAYTYGTNGIPLENNGDTLVVPYIDSERIKAKIKRAKQESDLVFVSIHWGDENMPFANATQKSLARMMADEGVDVIIGHHSHSIHPTEWLDRPDGGKTLVTYSLGNLLSGMQSPINIVGGMLSFDVIFYDDGKNPVVTNAKIIPTVCHFYGVPRDYHVYLFTDYTRELAQKHRLAGSVTFDSMKRLVTDTVAPEFLTKEFLSCDGN